jgi:hypothetical protein
MATDEPTERPLKEWPMNLLWSAELRETIAAREGWDESEHARWRDYREALRNFDTDNLLVTYSPDGRTFGVLAFTSHGWHGVTLDEADGTVLGTVGEIVAGLHARRERARREAEKRAGPHPGPQ